MASIVKARVEVLTMPLTRSFGIAGGSQPAAHNVLLELTLDDGTSGLGEAAPFPAANGETQAQARAALERSLPLLEGQPIDAWARIAASCRQSCETSQSALCAIETALLDAWCRRYQLPLWSFFGGREQALVSDITLVTGSATEADSDARAAAAQGFRLLKVKVGGATLAHDLERLEAIARAAPEQTWLLDANASFSSDEALALLDALGPLRERIRAFEQPCAADDFEGLLRVRRAGVCVVADESCRRVADVLALARLGAVDIVNLKATKSGLLGAWTIAQVARAHGFGLMIGGMVESILTMSASACLAAGLGGFELVDLDTPLFFAQHPFVGGYLQRGPELDLSRIRRGHGVERFSQGESPVL